MSAAYFIEIVDNHRFIDGNKRTGFVVGVLFLEPNGYCFTASEEDAAQAVLSLAAGTLDEERFMAFCFGKVTFRLCCLLVGMTV